MSLDLKPRYWLLVKMNSRNICVCASTLIMLALFASGAFAQISIGREFKGVKTIAVLPPRIDVYEFGAGSTLEKIDEWSARASQNVTSAVEKELKARSELEGVIITEATLSARQKEELEELNALYDVVRSSIFRHVLGLETEYFDERKATFDYSLGKETEKLLAADIDALLILTGSDQISSAGRNALNATAVVAAAALGAIYIPRSGLAQITMALVETKTGDVIWIAGAGGMGGTDLRSASSSTSLVNEIFRNFPIGTPHGLQTRRNALED